MTRSIIITSIAMLAAGAAVVASFDSADARGFARGGSFGGGGMRGMHGAFNGGRAGGAVHSPRMSGASSMHINRGQFGGRATNLGHAAGHSVRIGHAGLTRAGNGRVGANHIGNAHIGAGRVGTGHIGTGHVGNGRGGIGIGNANRSASGLRVASTNSSGGIGVRNAATGNSNANANGRGGIGAGNQNNSVRRFDGMGMGGSTPSTPSTPSTTPPANQGNPQVNNGGRQGGQPNAGAVIVKNWVDNFTSNVRGSYSVNSPGTAFSICQNLAWCAAGAPPGVASWLTAPLPSTVSSALEAGVNAFTPIDPKDPLSTPIDIGIKNFSLNPFNSPAYPKTGPAAFTDQ